MFLKLLRIYLKSDDRPFRKSFITTVVSFTLCVLPFLLIVAGDWVLYLIREFLKLLPSLNWAWLTAFAEWLLRGIEWIIENLSLMAMPALILLIGAVYVYFYLRRSSVMVMLTTYVFKRATEPFLALHFSAWLVKWLIIFKPFYFLDHLLNDMGLQNFGSGEMVTITLVMWFMLTLAFNNQLSKIREEKAARNEVALMDKIRLTLLEWVEKRQSN